MAMLKIVSGTLDSNAIEIEIKGTRFIASNETLEHVEVAEGNVHILIDTSSRSNGRIIHRRLCCKRTNALQTTMPSLMITWKQHKNFSTPYCFTCGTLQIRTSNELAHIHTRSNVRILSYNSGSLLATATSLYSKNTECNTTPILAITTPSMTVARIKVMALARNVSI